MFEQSIKSITTILKEDVNVVYNLIFRNAFYSLECFKEGSNKLEANDYFVSEDFTDDEGEAEILFRMIVKGKVFPVHIKDIVEDYFK